MKEQYLGCTIKVYPTTIGDRCTAYAVVVDISQTRSVLVTMQAQAELDGLEEGMQYVNYYIATGRIDQY